MLCFKKQSPMGKSRRGLAGCELTVTGFTGVLILLNLNVLRSLQLKGFCGQHAPYTYYIRKSTTEKTGNTIVCLTLMWDLCWANIIQQNNPEARTKPISQMDRTQELTEFVHDDTDQGIEAILRSGLCDSLHVHSASPRRYSDKDMLEDWS